MPYLGLRLYRHPSGAVLDPAAVIQKLQKSFPEATLVPGDQLALRAERAEAFLGNELRANPEGPGRTVVETLRRNAREFGPAYAFEIPLACGQKIRGTARRFDVTFLLDQPFPDDVRQRLLAFLQSFGVGWIEASVPGRRQSEILADMRGVPSGGDGPPAGVSAAQPSETP
jgi:hypothetical protein